MGAKMADPSEVCGFQPKDGEQEGDPRDQVSL